MRVALHERRVGTLPLDLILFSNAVGANMEFTKAIFEGEWWEIAIRLILILGAIGLVFEGLGKLIKKISPATYERVSDLFDRGIEKSAGCFARLVVVGAVISCIYALWAFSSHPHFPLYIIGIIIAALLVMILSRLENK
jgi:hypothetical protein